MKRITIKDIAIELNMAYSTVSRALNDNYGVHPSTKERVRQKARELGYIPDLGAKQLVSKRSDLIGVFMPEFEFEATPEFMEIFPPIHKALRALGKDVIIFSVPFSSYQPKSLKEWVQMRNLEGCVFMPPFSITHPLTKEALELQVPCVHMGGALGARCSHISSDDREGGRMVGRHLIEMGHRRIGFISGPKQLHICRERYTGFCDIYMDYEGSHGTEFMATGDFSGDSGARAAMELWNRSLGLTALFCANDLMAMGAIMALAQIGVRVPEEVSVVGYDGAFFTAYTNPPLTTVRNSLEKNGRRVAELLIELLNGGTGRSEVISPILIERSSTSQVQKTL